MTISVNSSDSSELPFILPADSADARRPYTVVPLGATTMLSTTRFVSRLAVKRKPAFCLLESMESIMRIKIRVPAGTVIFFALCGARDPTPAGIVFKDDAVLRKESPWATVSPISRAAAQKIRLRICLLSFVAFIVTLRQSAEKKRSADQ